MNVNFRHWLLDIHRTADIPFREGGQWNSPNPAPVYTVHDESNANLRAAVEWLAKELELWTPTDNRLEKSPLLKKAMYHLVGVLHPTAGSGGELQFDIVSQISKAVIRAAKEHHPQGQLDPESDETVQMAGSPVTLIRYLKTQWGQFHPKAAWQGGHGHTDPREYDRWFTDADERFKQQYHRNHVAPTAQEPAKVQDSQKQSSHGDISVMKVMHAMPMSFFTGKDINQIMAAAIEIAHNLQQSPPSAQDIQDFVTEKGLAGTKK